MSLLDLLCITIGTLLTGAAAPLDYPPLQNVKLEIMNGSENNRTTPRGQHTDVSRGSLWQNADFVASSHEALLADQMDEQAAMTEQPGEQIGAEMSPDDLEPKACSHRQTVSEPPPIASWHMEGV